MIGPITPMQMLQWMARRPSKSTRSYKRRHRAFLIWQYERERRGATDLYRRARKVLPLP